jgi:hypothetical protein
MTLNSYVRYGGCEAITNLRIPFETQIVRYKPNPDLGIIAEIRLDAQVNRFRGVIDLTKSCLSEICQTVWYANNPDTAHDDDVITYCIAGDLEELKSQLKKHPEVRLFATWTLDEENKMDKILLLARHLSSDHFALLSDDITFVRETLEGGMKAMSIPVQRIESIDWFD